MVIIFKYFCLSELASILNLKIQIYKEHKLYVQSWRKRKRMVGKWFILTGDVYDYLSELPLLCVAHCLLCIAILYIFLFRQLKF